LSLASPRVERGAATAAPLSVSGAPGSPGDRDPHARRGGASGRIELPDGDGVAPAPPVDVSNPPAARRLAVAEAPDRRAGEGRCPRGGLDREDRAPTDPRA